MPKFVLKEMESLYIEELKSSINLLMANLESLPVSKGSMDSKYGLQKLKRYNHRLHNHNNSYNVKHILMNYVTSFRSQGSLAKLEGDSADSDTQLTKLDVVLTFQLEVINFQINIEMAAYLFYLLSIVTESSLDDIYVVYFIDVFSLR